MLTDIHSESLAELLAQQHPPPDKHLLDLHINAGDVVEIQGGPSSGKTHLVYHLIISCISPYQYGGWNQAAIVFDMDHNFDVARINHLLIGHITRSSTSPRLDAPSAEYIAQQSLKKLHIFRPSSTAHLATTLLHIPTYHLGHFPDEAIGVVAIDSISSQYWHDRFIAEQTSAGSLTSGPGHAPPLYHVLLALRSFVHTHQSVVLMTNWGLYPLDTGDRTFYRQHLHPFPVLYRGSCLTSTHGQSSFENMPSLTCHITLRRSDTDVPLESESTTQMARIAVFIRRPKSPSIVKLSLHINAENTFTS